MIIVIEGQCMGIVLPAAKCDLNLSVAEQGAIGSMAMFGYILSSHFWGFLTDTWGRLKTLKLTLCLSFVSSLLSSFSVSSQMLLITRLIVGIWYKLK